jgi:hypothetical protein
MPGFGCVRRSRWTRDVQRTIEPRFLALDGQRVGTTSPSRRRTLLVLQLPLLELLFYKASDFLTGRRFALHTFDPKAMPELLIKVERDFLHARAPTLC